MNEKLNRLLFFLKDELRLYLSISFGVFLFVLFFQPFPLDGFDFNNKLIFVAGLATIVFLFMALVRATFQAFFHNDDQGTSNTILYSFLSGFIILALSSVAFAFYLRYVGSVDITFHIMIKVVLIASVPLVVLRLNEIITALKQQNRSLLKEKKAVQKQVEKLEEHYLNKTVEFISENGSENFDLLIADVAFIKSADNYVEIVFREGDMLRKKLLRNTLKNIEQQLKPYSNFIRCHRICIVNKHFIIKLHRNYSNHWLTVKQYEESLPVSRQYLLKLKEAL